MNKTESQISRLDNSNPHSIAAINLRAVEEVVRQSIRNNWNVSLYRQYKNQGQDKLSFIYSRGVAEGLRKRALNITDNLYYMMYPKHVSPLVQKHTSPLTVINSAVSSSISMNPRYLTQDPSKKMFGYNAVLNFTKALKGDKDAQKLLGDHTITMFDLEVIGSGRKKNGISDFHGIYDYAFVNVDGQGNSKKYTGLIGVNKQSDTAGFLESISSALEKGETLTEDQQVAYDFISRLGASKKDIAKVDGRWISERLTGDKNYKSLSNFNLGKQALYDIGEDQEKTYGKLGGHKQFIDDLAKLNKTPTTLVGHNSNAFDIMKIKSLEKVAPGISEYANSLGLNINKLSEDTYDMLEGVRKLSSQQQASLSLKMHPNGVDAVNPGGTAFQVESIWKSLFGTGAETHHSAIQDVIQQLNNLGVHFNENNQAYYKSNTFSKAILNNAEQVAEQTYNRQFFTLLPNRGGGMETLWSNPNVFVSMQDGDNLYFSNGVTAEVKDGKIVSRRDDNAFIPGAWNSRTGYTLDSDSIQILDMSQADEETKAYFREAKPEMRFGENDKFVMMKFSPLTTPDGRDNYLSSSNREITMLVPQDDFDQVMKESFNVIEYGGIDENGNIHTLQNTAGGNAVEKTIYDKATRTNGRKSLSPIGNLIANNADDKIIENTNRRFEQGSYSSLEKGLAMRLIGKNSIGEEHLGDLQEALLNVLKNPSEKNTKVFMDIVGGASLTEKEEVFVTNALGADWRTNLNTWQHTWDISGQHNSGWQNSSLWFFNNASENSLFGRYIVNKGGGKHTFEDKAEMQKMYANFADSMAIKGGEEGSADAIYKALGIDTSSKYRLDDGTRVFSTPKFLKRNLPKGVNLERSGIRLNLNSPYSAYNAFYRALNLDIDNMNEFQRTGLINDYINSLIAENRGLSKKTKKQLVGIAADDKMTARDKFVKAVNILNIRESHKDIFKPLNIQGIQIKSSALTQAVSDEEAETIIGESEKRTKELLKTNQLEKYMFGGDKKTAKANYKEQLKYLNQEEQDKSMIVLEKHIQDVKKYADKIGFAVQKAGGVMYEDRGRFYVSFNGRQAIDITQNIPRLKTNSGIVYTKFGNASWLSRLIGSISSNGNWQVSTAIEMASQSLGNLEQAFRDAKLKGEREEDVLQRRLSQAGKRITDKDNLATASLKTDTRMSNTMSYKGMVQDATQRQSLIDFLNVKYKEQPTETVKDLIRDLDRYNSDTAGSILPHDINTGINRLINDGVLPASFKLSVDDKIQEFNLNSDLKDTTLNQGNLGYRDVTYGAEAATRRYATSSQYVDEASIFIPKERTGEIWEEKEYFDPVVTDMDKTVTNINGLKVSNRIKVNAMDINTRIRDDLFDEYYKDKNIDGRELKLARRLKAMINPIEGGAAVNGALLEKTGLVYGTKVADLTNKEVLNTDRIAKTNDKFSISEDGKISYEYGDGFFVKKDDAYLKSFSNFDAEDEELVNKASLVTQKYFAGEGKNIALTDKETTNYVLQKAKELGIEIKSEEDFRAIADKYLSKKLVATPVTYDGNIKTKMGLEEKQQTSVILGTIGDAAEDSAEVEALLQSDELRKVSKATGIDFRNSILTRDVYNDLVSGNLSSPIFSGLNDEEKQNLRKLLEDAGGYMEYSRYAPANKMKEIFDGADFLSKSISDSYKHGFESSHFEQLVSTLHELTEKGELDRKKALDTLKSIISGPNVSINENSLQVDLGNGLDYTLNAENLNKAMEIYGPKAGETYFTHIGIQNIPVISKKAPKLDDRTQKTLMAKVFDKDYLDVVKKNMTDLDPEAFDNIYGDISDKQGMAIWNTDSFRRNMRSNIFFDGEDIFEPIKNPKTLLDQKRNAQYERIKKENNWADDKFIVSKQHIDSLVHANDAIEANNIAAAYGNDKSPEEIRKLMDDNGFAEKNYSDIKWDYSSNRYGYKQDKDAIWKHNTVVNLEGKNNGLDEVLDEDFFNKIDDRLYDLKKGTEAPYNSRHMVLPSHDSFAGEMPTSKDIGRDIQLKEYQSNAQSVFRRMSTLQNLVRKRGEETDLGTIQEYDDLIAKEKDSLADSIVRFNTSLRKYTKNAKEGTVFNERVNHGKDLSRRVKGFAFDTNTWDKDASQVTELLDPYGNDLYYKFNGKDYLLRDLHKQGHDVAFAVASTKDLEKYGFTDSYFKRLESRYGVTREAWLENAKKYGIDVFAHRDPNDYHLSTNAAKLYFSDYAPADSISVSSALAYSMKMDADGDDVTMMANSIRARGNNGFAVDTSVARLATKNREELADAEELIRSHQQDMAYNTFNTYKSREYTDVYAKDFYDKMKHNAAINAKREELVEAPAKYIYAQSKAYLGADQAKAYNDQWQSAKTEIRNLMAQNAETLGIQADDIDKMTDFSIRDYGNRILRNENISLNDSQTSLIENGLSSYNRMLAPFEANMAKTMRSSTGTMDTPFTVVNRLGHMLRTAPLERFFNPESASSLRMTDSQIASLDFVQEAAKEGFLSAKNNDNIAADEKMMGLAKRTNELIDDMLRHRNTGVGDKAAIELTDILSEYGQKKAVGRNVMINILGDETVKEISQRAAQEAEQKGKAFKDIEQAMLYNESIKKAVGNMRNLFSRVNDDVADQGLTALHLNLVDYSIHEILGTDVNDSRREEVTKFLKDVGITNVDQYNQAVKDSKENMDDMVRNSNMAKQMKKLKRMDLSNSVSNSKRMLGDLPGKGWSKSIMGLAAGIMFTSFVGGNPATPAGYEAQSMQTPQPQQYSSPIPPNYNNSISSMRNGPRKGYIININAQAGNNMNNDYISSAIAGAVRQNYNNSQINVNLQTQQRSDITYDQVYNYMEQSLF